MTERETRHVDAIVDLKSNKFAKGNAISATSPIDDRRRQRGREFCRDGRVAPARRRRGGILHSRSLRQLAPRAINLSRRISINKYPSESGTSWLCSRIVTRPKTPAFHCRPLEYRTAGNRNRRAR